MTNADTILLKNALDRWLDIMNYFDSDVQDAAERENKMSMYSKWEKAIDEMYNLRKDCEKFIQDEPKGD